MRLLLALAGSLLLTGFAVPVGLPRCRSVIFAWTILVAATLATNIITCGRDAELDPAAGAAAAGMLKMAFAH